jgi:outer membrane protein OmpA-like peptidoglycan-associated protein
MITRCTLGLTALAMLSWAPAAAAQDDVASAYPIDIEMVRPNFSADGLVGVDSPRVLDAGTITWGVLTQYQRNPLRLYEFDEVTGNIVSNRQSIHAGFSYSPTARISTRVVVPMGLHWGGEIPEYGGDGAGLGDISAGLRWHAGTWDRVSMGIHGDLVLPVGARDRYMGEAQPRTSFGLLAMLDMDKIDLLGGTSITTRANVLTNEDFDLGPELGITAGARYEIRPEKVFLNGEVIARGGLKHFLGGGAENSMEWLAEVQTWPKKTVRLDLGLGRGITEGYGTTGVRVLAGLTFRKLPEEDVIESELSLDWNDLSEDLPEIELEPPEIIDEPIVEPEWQQGQLARLEQTKISIRDPIQFELNTANILPESIPTLHAVAGLMNANPYIGHLVIEGHASVEGSFEWNYSLSVSRAQAIWEELFRASVHPDRMSYKGLGEVVPRAEGGTEDDPLAENRRVEFNIVKQYFPQEDLPDFSETAKLPWSGADHAVRNPPKPEKPEPKKPAPKKVDTDDEVQIEGVGSAPPSAPTAVPSGTAAPAPAPAHGPDPNAPPAAATPGPAAAPAAVETPSGTAPGTSENPA